MSYNKILTQQEIDSTIQTLQKLTLGSIPYDIFIEICRLTVAPVIDIVPFVIVNNEPKVILRKRPHNDQCFGDLYHIPGCVLSPIDEKYTFKSVFKRIYKKDLDNTQPISGPYYIDFNFYETVRGSEFSLLHWAIFPNTIQGDLFEFNHLPKNIVPHQYEFIKKAYDNFIMK